MEPTHVSVPLPASAYAQPPMPELPDLDFASTDFNTPSFRCPGVALGCPPFAPAGPAPADEQVTDWSGLHSRGAVDETPPGKESYDEFLDSFDATDLAGLDAPAERVKPGTAPIAGAEDIDFFSTPAPSTQDFAFESTDLQPLHEAPADASSEAMIDFPLEFTAKAEAEAPVAPDVAPVAEVDFDPLEAADAAPQPQAASMLEAEAWAEVPDDAPASVPTEVDHVIELKSEAEGSADAAAALDFDLDRVAGAPVAAGIRRGARCGRRRDHRAGAGRGGGACRD